MEVPVLDFEKYKGKLIHNLSEISETLMVSMILIKEEDYGIREALRVANACSDSGDDIKKFFDFLINQNDDNLKSSYLTTIELFKIML